MKYLKFFPAILLLFAITGCSGCKKSKSREKPDVSGIHLDVSLQRFDLELWQFNREDYSKHEAVMQNEYGPFYNFYIQQFVIGPRPVSDTANIDEMALKKFIADGYIRRLQDSINLTFKSTKDIDAELTQSFKYFKYYFPKGEVPRVIGINSGFALGAFTYGKDVLGIGLDLYLGANNPDYDSAGIYQYLHHKMTRAYIPRNAMEVWYNLNFGADEPTPGRTLLEAMANKGKKMYFLSYMLPDAPDDVITGFTPEQIKWCEANEYEIWKFLNDKDLLYKEDVMEQKRYLDEGPSIPGMPAEAPGNIGSWIGLQIARKFIKETGNKISLQDFVTRYDAKTILEKAKYRPSKSVF